MDLAAWLAQSGTTPADFARRCGVHLVTVYKWKTGVMTPRATQLAAIARATGGAVTANDFVSAIDAPVADQTAGFAETQLPLATEARALGLDPDAIAARAVGDAVRAEKARRWQEENREAIAAWNAWTEENDLPLAAHRMF